MPKQLPTILFAAATIVLIVLLYGAKQEITELKAERDAWSKKTKAVFTTPETAPRIKRTQADGDADIHSQKTGRAQEDISGLEAQAKKESAQRIMRDMAKTINDNPTINKMVEASQRGAIGALYSDMVEYLALDAEESEYFMDLLMQRQMAHVDMHMKIATGNLSDEEREALQEQTRLANEIARSEMENFLNNPDDFEEFQFYEDTIGERMMLSQMDQTLGDAALSDETYREVLGIMHEERENYNWSTNLHDSESTDMSPTRFSEENISKHIADMTAVGKLMDQRMQAILPPEQLAAWRQSGAAMQALVSGQLIQANQAFSKE